MNYIPGSDWSLMAGDGTLVPDWLRAAVSVVLRILRNTCGLTKGSRGFPQPGDPAGYAERGEGGGHYIIGGQAGKMKGIMEQ